MPSGDGIPVEGIPSAGCPLDLRLPAKSLPDLSTACRGSLASHTGRTWSRRASARSTIATSKHEPNTGSPEAKEKLTAENVVRQIAVGEPNNTAQQEKPTVAEAGSSRARLLPSKTKRREAASLMRLVIPAPESLLAAVLGPPSQLKRHFQRLPCGGYVRRTQSGSDAQLLTAMAAGESPPVSAQGMTALMLKYTRDGIALPSGGPDSVIYPPCRNFSAKTGRRYPMPGKAAKGNH